MATEDCLPINGASPRLRGTVVNGDLDPGALRFIPAPAGNSLRNRGSRAQPAVHPRACGEQPRNQDLASPSSGSSPRLRGTELSLSHRSSPARFIPAPAGNSLHWPSRKTLISVHPRACGEQVLSFGGESLLSGSSPRLRGTVPAIHHRRHHGRFIPAPAGNSDVAVTHLITVTVHPRACGEQRVTQDLGPLKIGSSPRLRGTDLFIRTWLLSVRFIPAPAGNRP